MKKTPTILAAVLAGDGTALRAAIAKGVDLDSLDRHGRAALHHAVLRGNVENVQVLLDAGASASLADKDGWTPLHFAAQSQDTRVAECLLAAGAVVDAEDQNGNTPLARAVFESRGRGDMIELLVRFGANKEHENKRGVSPQKLAAMIANYDVLQWLK